MHSQVPFGHVKYAKEWLGVTGGVKRPEREHPKRPIQGLECTKSEVCVYIFFSFSSIFLNEAVHNYITAIFI